MQGVEVTRAGDLPVSDQLDEMRCWLDAERIRATDLQAVIVGGRAKFTASFATVTDVDRFVRRFGDLGWRKHPPASESNNRRVRGCLRYRTSLPI